MKRLSDFGLLKVIHPNLLFTEDLEATLKSMHETLTWFNLLFLEEKPDSGILYLMALLSGLKDEDTQVTMERLSPSPRVKEMIINGIVQARNVVRKFPLQDPVETHKLLGNLKLEVVLFSMALSKDQEKAEGDIPLSYGIKKCQTNTQRRGPDENMVYSPAPSIPRSSGNSSKRN